MYVSRLTKIYSACAKVSRFEVSAVAKIKRLIRSIISWARRLTMDTAGNKKNLDTTVGELTKDYSLHLEILRRGSID